MEIGNKNVSLWIVIPVAIVMIILAIGTFNGHFISTLSGLLWVLGYLSIFLIIMGFGAMTAKFETGCLWTLIAIIICAGSLFGADYLGNYAKEKEMYEAILNEPTAKECENYLYKYPQSKHSDSVRASLLEILVSQAKNAIPKDYKKKSSIEELLDFSENYSETKEGKFAKSTVTLLCDSLYDCAVKENSERVWKHYQSCVPENYYKDSQNKLDIIEQQKWNTENKAWRMVTSTNEIASYNKYLSMYPHGEHAKEAESRLVDMELSGITNSEHGSLPTMDRVGYGNGKTSRITVHNSTSYTLILLYSGPMKKRCVLSAHSVTSISLPNGDYSIGAKVNASNVRSYAGEEMLNGGDYEVEYYIMSSY